MNIKKILPWEGTSNDIITYPIEITLQYQNRDPPLGRYPISDNKIRPKYCKSPRYAYAAQKNMVTL